MGLATVKEARLLQRRVRARHLAALMTVWFECVRACRNVLAPLLDFAVRLWIGQTFFVSGLLKISNWDNALQLASSEYPVDWLDAASAAFLGASVEVLGGLLLTLGLATRIAALPMLVLSVLTQLVYRQLDAHLFWSALLLWFAVHGAGALSLDRLFGRGLVSLPLPFMGGLRRVIAWLVQPGTDIVLLVMRLWLAAACIAAAGALPGAFGWVDWLPVASLTPLGRALALALCAMLVLGLCVRLAVAGAAVALNGAAMMNGVFPAADPGLGSTLFLLLAVQGPGVVSLDAWAARWLRRRFPQLQGKPAFALADLPHVVIVGAGFGGLACARALRHAPVRLTLIDRRNYHLFQPLLYQVATAALSPGDIAMPVRSVLRDQANATVVFDEVEGVDTDAREVCTRGGRIAFDYLVLATGASHSYFGRDEWAEHAPGLKRVEDAVRMRSRVLAAFERAEACADPVQREALLTFLIVGGGPTGVELAGAIAELARLGMEKEFRNFDPAQARVILVQAAPRLLPSFPEDLSQEAKRALEALGVQVMVGSRVQHIDAEGITLDGRRIAARSVFWAAGVVASPAARWLDAAADAAMRVRVDEDLRVPGHPGVFAVGDTAASLGWAGQPVPGLAPAAKQGGLHVARVIAASVQGDRPPRSFRYRHLGSLATIGRKAAVAEFGRLRLRGAVAWWLWGIVHVGFLVGVRNRISVALDWCWAYLTYRSSTRLISAETSDVPPAEPSRRADTRVAA